MTNKEVQIKSMAKIIAYCHGEKESPCSFCRGIATKIYDAGYRLPPVLDEEEQSGKSVGTASI